MENPDSKTTRRRVERIQLTIPVRVDCPDDEENPWTEMTRFNAISSFGAGFNLTRQVQEGQLLRLTTSFPSKLRFFDYSEMQYKIWTLVRHCDLIAGMVNETYLVGVAFIGKNPPLSYLRNPRKRYILSGFNKNGFGEISEFDTVNEQGFPETESIADRIEERYQIPYEVVIEILDDDKKPIDHEFSVTENVSLSGCALKSILGSHVGRFVRINVLETNTSLLAIVRNRRIGDDGVPRLHLEFLEDKFPLHGIG